MLCLLDIIVANHQIDTLPTRKKEGPSTQLKIMCPLKTYQNISRRTRGFIEEQYLEVSPTVEREKCSRVQMNVLYKI